MMFEKYELKFILIIYLCLHLAKYKNALLRLLSLWNLFVISIDPREFAKFNLICEILKNTLVRKDVIKNDLLVKKWLCNDKVT